jgi:hypothetical protein
MSRGGKREGAGRPKGALTKKTRLIAEQAMAEGTTPIEVMLKAMRYALGRAYREDGTVDFDMLRAANDFAAQPRPTFTRAWRRTSRRSQARSLSRSSSARVCL